MCNLLEVSYNAYYHWKTKPKLTCKKSDVLKTKIKVIFRDNKDIYGASKIKKILDRQDTNISVAYVSRLMKSMNLKSVVSKKYIVTTDSKHSYKVSSNMLNRDFKSSDVGFKWVSDISYVKVGNRWNYLTVIIDLADRKVVGYRVSKTMKAEDTVIACWYMAKSSREIKEGFIFHSDRGVQYACEKMRTIFSYNQKITQSMSKKGDCWDNAVAESFFKTIKYEWLNRFKFDNTSQLEMAVDDYIQWYNTTRIHASLGYKTPLEKQMKLMKTKYKKVA